MVGCVGVCVGGACWGGRRCMRGAGLGGVGGGGVPAMSVVGVVGIVWVRLVSTLRGWCGGRGGGGGARCDTICMCSLQRCVEGVYFRVVFLSLFRGDRAFLTALLRGAVGGRLKAGVRTRSRFLVAGFGGFRWGGGVVYVLCIAGGWVPISFPILRQCKHVHVAGVARLDLRRQAVGRVRRPASCPVVTAMYCLPFTANVTGIAADRRAEVLSPTAPCRSSRRRRGSGRRRRRRRPARRRWRPATACRRAVRASTPSGRSRPKSRARCRRCRCRAR